MAGAREELLEGDALAGCVRVYGDESRIRLHEKIAARGRGEELEPLPRSRRRAVGCEGKLGWSWSRSGSGGVGEVEFLPRWSL